MNSKDRHTLAARSIPVIEPEYLPSVLSTASDLALVITEDGRTTSVMANEKTGGYGNLDHWHGRPLFQFLTQECQGKLQSILDRFAAGEPGPITAELNHRDNATWQFPIRYVIHRVGREGALLMLGRDLQQVAETQQQLVQAQVALERGYEERREFDARYRMLMAATRDAFVLVSVSDGRIRDLNAAAANVLGSGMDELEGAAFAQEFKDRRRTEFVESLLNVAMSETNSDLPVVTRSTRRAISVSPMLFRAAGERYLFCRLDPDDAEHPMDDRLSMTLNAMFRDGKDAIVFTDPKGVIEAANEAFVDMIDFGNISDVKGRSISDYLARGQIDTTVLLENAMRSGHMRVYSTRLKNELGGWTAVEISVSYLNIKSRPSVAFLVRDASRVEAMRTTLNPQSEEAVHHNVAELVGSAKLKDIVAETNDVIEKMCIETAIELTQNNRAAAAEMLGLSRQSLYVKLRKYGLQDRDGDS
ncbi:transcriptional regulator PpsR [Sedimentitalea arenosa]|jgi:transcriptional regulator PpsR|uniref:Transcriptional regulator PpsR n=1 Tax=Sedimentitalea arenosa TaxID=2798803 RepID=A0A8J7J7G0_9RHOB|nr:transcriptional regulator PpsR [Arenibacterium arenosum]MBJ6370094.1 transcriptional regulator PpsR [Arenibacterium arenosum]